MLSVVMLILKLFGYAEEALAFKQVLSAKKKAQDIANMPTTKQERKDAADRGGL